MRKTLVLIFIFIGIGCSQNSSDFFIGKWQILRVVEDTTSIALNDNWIHIKSDGTFTGYDGESNTNENGKWTYKINEKVLYLDDASGEGASPQDIIENTKIVITSSLRSSFVFIIYIVLYTKSTVYFLECLSLCCFSML